MSHDPEKLRQQELEKDVGFRISVFISQDRDDLQELFWQNLFPSDADDTKTAIRCRTRDYIDDVQGIILERPEEERIAVRLGVWDEMQYRNGKLIVTSNLYSLIEEEERRRDCGKSKTGRMRTDYHDSR